MVTTLLFQSFATAQEAEGRSPLAAQLFRCDERIRNVMVGDDFVTVTIGEDDEWDALDDRQGAG
jgi:hypothetical protein